MCGLEKEGEDEKGLNGVKWHRDEAREGWMAVRRNNQHTRNLADVVPRWEHARTLMNGGGITDPLAEVAESAPVWCSQFECNGPDRCGRR